MAKQKSIRELIESLRETVLKQSLAYIEKMSEGKHKDDPDELKHLNDMKKHLKFAENIYKQLHPKEKELAGGNRLPPEVLAKIKNIEKSVGEIMRTLPSK